jgi:hypothetical protein
VNRWIGALALGLAFAASALSVFVSTLIAVVAGSVVYRAVIAAPRP